VTGVVYFVLAQRRGIPLDARAPQPKCSYPLMDAPIILVGFGYTYNRFISPGLAAAVVVLKEAIDMTSSVSSPATVAYGSRKVSGRSDVDVLRTFAIAAGICWSVLFVVIGLRYELQMYADGSIFSYAIAVRDAWAFHWHNISDRLFVYLFCHLPAELYVELAGDPYGGIVVYGFLFFVAPLLGLIATFAADRSLGHIIFSYACLSTACLCPLVFGFPTEMWTAHALFWPTLAVCHYARNGKRGIALVFATLLALVFTHEGALIFAVAIVATLSFRGVRDAAFLRVAGAFFVVLSIWAVVKATFTPDPYVAIVLHRAALHVFDVTILASHLILLLLITLASYGIAFYVVRRLGQAKASIRAASMVALGLSTYWLCFDGTLHTDNRYYLRTVLLIATPVLGVLAAVYALRADDRLNFAIPFLQRPMAILAIDAVTRSAVGAIVLVTLVHLVEMEKFVRAWRDYQAAVRTLATGTPSDPALGDPHFVSSDRIDPESNRPSWSSTTHFLSVLIAPRFAPARLVIDPNANYFWLSCTTATANQEADRAVPAESRRLVRVYACLHR